MTNFGDDVRKTVSSLLQGVNRPPFLFVGSGMSRRYAGTPDWDGLLRSICDECDFMGPYAKYQAEASHKLGERFHNKNVRMPEIATCMENKFLSIYDRPEWQGWLSDHHNPLHPMKEYIADRLRKCAPDRKKKELDILRGASRNVAGVITTNYDKLMENVFPDFDVYYRQSDMIFASLAEVGEIYKIHGSVDDAESLVVDSDDYEALYEEQKYSIAKIMTIFAECPVIFLGYSYNDEDVKTILATIAQCAGSKKTRQFSSRFLFVDYSDDRAIIDKDFGSDVEMRTIRTKDFAPVYQGIADSPQRFSPKLVRQLRRQIVTAAYSTDNRYKAVLAPLESLDELPPDKPIVVGLNSPGYGREPTLDEINRGVLFHSDVIAPELVVGPSAETLIKKYSGKLPIFYYMSKYKGHPNQLAQDILHNVRNMEAMLSETDKKKRRKAEKNGIPAVRSIQGLVLKFGDEAYKKIVLLKESEIDVEELEKLLIKVVNGSPSGSLNPELRKDIRILDYFKYGTHLIDSCERQ